MRVQGTGLLSAASVVLMAAESLLDEAYYVAKNMFNNVSLTDNTFNKHGAERDAMRFRFPLKNRLRSGVASYGKLSAVEISIHPCVFT